MTFDRFGCDVSAKKENEYANLEQPHQLHSVNCDSEQTVCVIYVLYQCDECITVCRETTIEIDFVPITLIALNHNSPLLPVPPAAPLVPLLLLFPPSQKNEASNCLDFFLTSFNLKRVQIGQSGACGLNRLYEEQIAEPFSRGKRDLGDGDKTSSSLLDSGIKWLFVIDPDKRRRSYTEMWKSWWTL